MTVAKQEKQETRVERRVYVPLRLVQSCDQDAGYQQLLEWAAVAEPSRDSSGSFQVTQVPASTPDQLTEAIKLVSVLWRQTCA